MRLLREGLRPGSASLLGALALCLTVGCGERGGTSRRAPARDAAPPAAPARDAAPPVSPRAVAGLTLGRGCACAAVPADALRGHLAARRALVAHLDVLNRGLRQAMARLDAAAGPRDATLADVGPHRVVLAGLRCQLDCLLAQFLGFTPPAWAYLEQVARFLDRFAAVLSRLAQPAASRPPGPGASALAAVFNEVVRRSNHSIGLELLAPVKVPTPQGLDALAFGAKVRRWRLATAALLTAHLRGWTDATRAAPAPRVAAEPVTLRVAHARLRQALADQARLGGALTCERGKPCPALGPRWTRTLAALEGLIKATTQVDTALRAAGGGPLTAAARVALWKPFEEARVAFGQAAAATLDPR